MDAAGLPLGDVEASANANKKRLAEPLPERLLGEDIEVKLIAGDSQFEPDQAFEHLEAKKIGSIIPWRRLKGRENPSDALSVKDRIDAEDPEHPRLLSWSQKTARKPPHHRHSKTPKQLSNSPSPIYPIPPHLCCSTSTSIILNVSHDWKHQGKNQ